MITWQKQDKEPLYPDLLWSRPENKRTAGKLLIIGGNTHAFSAPGIAYESAVQSGIGSVKVLLPEGLRKTIGAVLENCEYAPMNKSGSFSKSALAEWLEWASWADGVLLAGDVGRNSETTIVTEQFLKTYTGQITVTQDVIDQFRNQPELLFERPNTTIVASFSQLQKIWPTISKDKQVIQYGNSLTKNVEIIQATMQYLPVNLVTKHLEIVIVSVVDRVSTTPYNKEIWRVETAGKIAVWWLQNPNKSFEALTTSLISI